MSLESAGSRPVIVGNSKEPRTRHRHPVTFTANCPHRDSGMKESCLDVFEGLAEKRRWSPKIEARGVAQAVRVRNVSGDFWGQLVSVKKIGFRRGGMGDKVKKKGEEAVEDI